MYGLTLISVFHKLCADGKCEVPCNVIFHVSPPSMVMMDLGLRCLKVGVVIEVVLLLPPEAVPEHTTINGPCVTRLDPPQHHTFSQSKEGVLGRQ